MDAKTLTLKTFTTHTVIFSRKKIKKRLQILMAMEERRHVAIYILCLSSKFQNIGLLFLNLNTVQIRSFPKKILSKKGKFCIS